VKRQLDHLMPGAGIEDYTAVLDQCYGKSPLREVLREAVDKEMDAEMAPLREQLKVSLSVSPSSWVQRVHQGKKAASACQGRGPCIVAGSTEYA
jgi:hypothetical protein